MKVLITETAWSDLLAITTYVAADSRSAADRLLDQLYEACVGLGETPEAWPVVPRYADLGVRRRVVGNYLVFYRVIADSVVVLHVLHGARDLDAVLSERNS